MLDFFSSDLFTLILEIALLIFIGFDLKNYRRTRKKEHLLNIALAVGFFFYALWPLYTKHFGWSEEAKSLMQNQCLHDTNASLCSCVNDALFKTFDQRDYEKLSAANAEELSDFLAETRVECMEE